MPVKQMVNNYELLKRLEKSEDFKLMLKRGMIPVTVISQKIYYEKYKSYCKKLKKGKAVIETSIYFKVSVRTIQYAIKNMESE